MSSELAAKSLRTVDRMRFSGRLWMMLALVTAPVLAVDQLAKLYVSTHFQLYQMRPIVPGWLDLTYTLNPGAAFSMFANMPAAFRNVFFVGLSAVATVVLIVLMARRTTTLLSSIAFALVLGGTIGNLIDRIERGLVVDFIYFHHESFRYPVFNLADSAITIGVAMIVLFSWMDGRKIARVAAVE